MQQQKASEIEIKILQALNEENENKFQRRQDAMIRHTKLSPPLNFVAKNKE